MSDFKEIISYKRYLLVEGLGTFKYGANLNHFLTEKTGNSHFKRRIYYDVKVKVLNEPKSILGSDIVRLYSSKFGIQKIDEGITVYHHGQVFFFEADYFYLENNIAPSHVQPEGEESHGDFEEVPVFFIVHEIKQKEVCKKGISTGNLESRIDGVYKEYTTGEFIEGTDVCATIWRKEGVESPKHCIKNSLTGEREDRDNCYRLEFYSGEINEESQTCETFWGEWICDEIPPSTPPPPPPLGCLSIVFLLVVLLWAAFMIKLAISNGSFMPILFGIGLPLLLFGFIQFIGRLGRISRYFVSLLRWSLNLLLLIVIFSAIDGILNIYESRSSRQESNIVESNDSIEVTEVNPNNENNSNTVNEEKEVQKPYKLVQLKWEDQDRTKYNGSFKLYIEDINRSLYNLKRIESENYNSFTDIYSSVYETDKNYLNGLYQMLDSIKEKNQQSSIEFANTVVSMIQSIEYVLVLDKSCEDPYNRRNPIIRELLDSGIKCVGPAPFGLNTPTEFLATTNGDCDTRTLLLYTILKHYKFDVAILNSEYYGHSMLGLNIAEGRGMYKSYNGKKYYFWETTQIGPHLGELQREVGNVNYWKLTLN